MQKSVGFKILSEEQLQVTEEFKQVEKTIKFQFF